MQVINGTTYIAHEEHDALRKEALAIHAAMEEEGCSNMADFEYVDAYIAHKLGTTNWDVTAADEPDDGYDMDRYY